MIYKQQHSLIHNGKALYRFLDSKRLEEQTEVCVN